MINLFNIPIKQKAPKESVATMNCHYCGNPFPVVRKRVNLVLFACEPCKSEKKHNPLHQLTQVNEYTL